MSSESQVNVLVVDDNPAQRMALGAALSALDLNLVEASSGREALRILLTREFALILLDVNMPGMDGLETAALIRARPSSEHTPIILITASGDEAFALRGYSLGVVDYILTPVQPEVLRTKVSVFVELYRKTDEIRRQRETLRRRAAQLQRLSRASLAINSADDLDAVLQIMTMSAAEIVGSRHANATAAPGEDLRMLTASVTNEPGVQGPRTSPSNPESSLSDAWTPAATADLPGGHAGRSGPSSATSTRRTGPDRLSAPLTARDGRMLGMVELTDKLEGDFTPEDEDIVFQLAQMCSVALENLVTAEAREANRLKDEFLGVLSHELRTPLQAMLTWIGILRRDTSDAATHARALDVIERSARAQAQLIEDLLDVSRIIRGQLRLALGPVDLVHVTEMAIEALKPAATAKLVEIGFEHPTAECSIVGDAARLQQIVWNLVSNAVKFTPQGGRVAIHLCEKLHDVELEVRDSGEGIAPDFLPHVFERFRQADSTTGRRHGGLGLGLAIVRSLVELHGGEVRGANAPPAQNDQDAQGMHGAVFTVTLPRRVHSRMPAEPARVTLGIPLAVTNGSRLDGIRVVLVEDEAEAREALSTALGLLGANVVAVASAHEALRVLDDSAADVLLSDIGMAGMDGYSLIRTLRSRESEGGRHLPAAALTAYVRPEDCDAALRAGFDAHVSKPVEPLEVARAVRRLVGATTIKT